MMNFDTATLSPALLMAALLFLPGISTPQEAPKAASSSADDLALFRAVTGKWGGVLEYRDYQSGLPMKLPVRLESLTQGGAPHATWRIEFVDPGRVVPALDVIRRGKEAGHLVIHSFGQSGHSVTEHPIVARKVEAPTRWMLTSLREDRDGGKPASIRTTWERKDDRLIQRTEVRYRGQPKADWFQRNRVELRRVAVPKPESLKGSWTVDLRPTPDAPPYLQPFVIEAVKDGRLEGRFYGTSFENGRINADWGRLHLAFTTRDGTGVYHSQAVLRDGVLHGTTHSLGRDFLSVWTARRK